MGAIVIICPDASHDWPTPSSSAPDSLRPQLVLTSNRSPVDWYPLFPNPAVAESLLDRLINTSHGVFLNGPSYRPKQASRPAHLDTEGSQRVKHQHGPTNCGRSQSVVAIDAVIAGGDGDAGLSVDFAKT